MDRRALFRSIDFMMILTVLGLAAVGMLALYSIASASDGAVDFARKQLVWIAAGLVAMVVVGSFNYSRLKHYTPFIYAINLSLLLFIFIMGKTAMGAQRWIEIGFFRFQPSEFSKIFVIITLAAYLAERRGEIAGWREVIVAIVHVSPTILLILIQPDLGTALVIGAAVLGMFLIGGVKPKQMGILLVAVYLAGVLVVKIGLLHEYQVTRLLVFVNPDIDPLGSGYNLKQSIIAIGSGGIFGKGLFYGTQSRLDFLPPAVRHTDFVFAVIGEELGFIGGAVLIGLFFLLLTRTLRTALISRSYFGLLLTGGIVTMWLFQILVNVGMTIGIMPVTGIPLPFISYGGSSMLMNMVAVGLVLSVYARRWS